MQTELPFIQTREFESRHMPTLASLPSPRLERGSWCSLDPQKTPHCHSTTGLRVSSTSQKKLLGPRFTSLRYGVSHERDYCREDGKVWHVWPGGGMEDVSEGGVFGMSRWVSLVF